LKSGKALTSGKALIFLRESRDIQVGFLREAHLNRWAKRRLIIIKKIARRSNLSA